MCETVQLQPLLTNFPDSHYSAPSIQNPSPPRNTRGACGASERADSWVGSSSAFSYGPRAKHLSELNDLLDKLSVEPFTQLIREELQTKRYSSNNRLYTAKKLPGKLTRFSDDQSGSIIDQIGYMSQQELLRTIINGAIDLHISLSGDLLRAWRKAKARTLLHKAMRNALCGSRRERWTTACERCKDRKATCVPLQENLSVCVSCAWHRETSRCVGSKILTMFEPRSRRRVSGRKDCRTATDSIDSSNGATSSPMDDQNMYDEWLNLDM